MNNVTSKSIIVLLFSMFLFTTSSWAINSHYEEGLKWKDQGNMVEALKHFEKAILEEPEYQKLVKEYALAAFETKAYAKAIPAYEKLITKEKNNIEYLIRLAKMYSYSSKKYKADEYAQQALKLNPTNPDQIFSLANTYYFIKHYPKAITLYEKIAKEKPEALAKMASCYTKMQQFNLAVKTYDRMLKDDNDQNANVYYEFGLALYNNSDYSRSVSILNKAKELGFYGQSRIDELLALSFIEMKQFDQAVQSFLSAIKSDPYNKNLNLNLVDCYTKANRFSEARNLLDNLMEQMPNDAEFVYSYGMTFYKEGKTSRAEKYFNEAFVLNPALKNLRYTKSSL